jgi:hypothetical protein
LRNAFIGRRACKARRPAATSTVIVAIDFLFLGLVAKEFLT